MGGTWNTDLDAESWGWGLVCGVGRGLSHDLPFPEEGAAWFWQHCDPVGQEQPLQSGGLALTLQLGQVSPLL